MRQHRIMAAAIAVVAYLGAASGAFAKPIGTDFLHHAIEGDNSEMTLGKIAAQRGGTPGVREFGRMLATDHSNGKLEAAGVARKLNTYVPRSMAPEAIREKGKLSRLSGRDFDREFANYMVEDHKNDIADFEAEAAAVDDPPIVALAKKTLPVLRKHLETASRLAAVN